MYSDFIFSESLQVEKGSVQFNGIYVFFSIQFHLHLEISKRILRSKGGTLMSVKASKMFLIHHFNLFSASSEI